MQSRVREPADQTFGLILILLMIEILHDFTYQNANHYGSTVQRRSRSMYVISGMSLRQDSVFGPKLLGLLAIALPLSLSLFLSLFGLSFHSSFLLDCLYLYLFSIYASVYLSLSLSLSRSLPVSLSLSFSVSMLACGNKMSKRDGRACW